MTVSRLPSTRSFQNLALAIAITAVAATARAECPIPTEGFTPDPVFTSDFLLKRCEAGEFEFDKWLCVTSADTTACERKSEDEKRYVARIGIIQDEDLELVS